MTDGRSLSCEYARTWARTIPSHDWHVQPSCQRPKTLPAWAGRIQSSQIFPCERGRSHLMESGCPRNLL